EVRDALGLSLGSDGLISTTFPDAEVLKGLVRIVRDLDHDKIKVADIYAAKDRKKYIASFKSSDRPSPGKELEASRPLIGGDAASGGSRTGSTKTTKTPKARATLIPSTCTCDVKG